MWITLLNGLTYGGLLFIIAVGLSLVFGVMRVINMSHGVMYLAAAYVALTVQQTTGNWALAVLAACLALAAAAVILQWVVGFVDGDMPQTLLTLGVTLALSDLCLWVWGGLPATIPPPQILTQPITIGQVVFPGFRLFLLSVAILLGVVIWVIMVRTRLGRLLRAGVDDRQMLSAIGVNVHGVFLMAWLITGALVGLAGSMGGSYLAFGPGTEFSILTLALVVVIIGGIGSLAGSAIGALIVGLVDSFGRAYLGELSSFLLMGTLVLVLAIRPQGILGRVEQ